MPRSAGVLIHRGDGNRLEVLLVHPGGPFWRNKTLGVWQLPKGLLEPGEDDEAAARREVAEELGIIITGELKSLGTLKQAGGKIVAAFAIESDFDPNSMVSNMIEVEWPPRSKRMVTIPEIDEARWFNLDEAREHILPSQAPFLDRLVEASAGSSRDGAP